MPLMQSNIKQYAIVFRTGEILTGVAPINPKRILLLIQNRSHVPFYVKFDDPIQAANSIIRWGDGTELEIQPNDYIKFENPDSCPKGRISLHQFVNVTNFGPSPDKVTAMILEGSLV